jgi:opacity protein-like surface antigen
MIAGAATAWSQAPADSPYYARTNTYSLFTAYSDDSSHIVLGDAENRKLLEFGVGYGRRLFVNRIVNWQYNAEILPVALESDPLVVITDNWTSPTVSTDSGTRIQLTPCIPSSGSFSRTQGGKTYSYTYTITCSRQWTVGEGLSPVGFQWNFMPRRKLQPFFIAHGGYMYSTHPIPMPDAGSFNFTFDFGAGIEVFRSKTRSVRAEYRIHHISDAYTSNANPGIDNGLFQLTYSFGR